MNMKETENNKNFHNQSANVYGNNTNILYTLKQKMKTDSELLRLMTLFESEDNDNERIKIVEEILIRFTGAYEILGSSKGNFINAKYLFILEKLDKLSLISFSKKCCRHIYSEIELADLINSEFENLKLEIYAKLMYQIYFKTSADFINNENKPVYSVKIPPADLNCQNIQLY